MGGESKGDARGGSKGQMNETSALPYPTQHNSYSCLAQTALDFIESHRSLAGVAVHIMLELVAGEIRPRPGEMRSDKT